MEERNVATWEHFIEGLDEIRKERTSSTEYVQNSPLLFRGQGNSCWQLGATLERKRERMPYKDYYRIISKIKPQIETLVGGDWPIPSYPEVERLVTTYEEFNNILWAGDRPGICLHGLPPTSWVSVPAAGLESITVRRGVFCFCEGPRGRPGESIHLHLVRTQLQHLRKSMQVVYTFGPYVKTHRRHVCSRASTPLA